MSVTKSLFRIVGVLILALISVTARAQAPAAADTASEQLQEPADAKSQDSLLVVPAGDQHPAATPAADAPAAPTPPAPATAAPAADLVVAGAKVEPITERYPNGSVKIERQVTQDDKGNYVNHGTYTVYSQDGTVMKSGEFRDGKLYGKWTQRFTKDEGHLFSADREKEFQGPFVSEATFAEGLLNGVWSIKDRNGQSVIEWSFDHGVRDGKWSWSYPNGQKRLEATYKDGALTGDVVEFDINGKQVSQNTYIDGRCLAKTTGWYSLGQKHFEGYYLRVQNLPTPSYDWWNGSVTTTAAPAGGKDQKHNLWTEWYQSGNKKAEGQYDHDLPVGKFLWWYENGQKQGEGEYALGQRTGTWISWHPNGLKEWQAEYKDGNLVSKWMHWDENGKVVEIRDFDATHPQTPQASTPQPRKAVQTQGDSLRKKLS
jgi:antitoxin component YwqK of YwqJK toxin-antitoxin module